jgi:hypothetical protein
MREAGAPIGQSLVLVNGGSQSELRKKLAMKKNGRPRRIAFNKRLKQKQEAKKREAVSPNFSK